MTFFTGTVSEVIYSMPAAGTALASSVTKTVISSTGSATLPAFQLPTPLWQPSYAVGRALRITAGGTFGTTGTPTLQIWVYVDTTQGTAGTILAATGAFTSPSGVTNGSWYLNLDLNSTTQGLSSNVYTQAVYTNGYLSLGTANNAATAAATTYMIGTPQATVSYNPLATNYVEVWAQWGTSSASNTIQCTEFMVAGLN